jgi:hypothetical protein
MNANLPETLVLAMTSMNPSKSLDVPKHPLPVVDPLSPEVKAAFDRIFLLDRDRQNIADRTWFGERS